MKFKEGDKVLINTDLRTGLYKSSEWLYDDVVTEGMLQYKGMITTVTSCGRGKYELEIDDGEWKWVDTMLTDLNGCALIQIEPQVGDYVKIREDLKVNYVYCSDYYDYDDIVVKEMMEYKGKFAKVITKHNGDYGIDIDDLKWNWIDDMFEGVVHIQKKSDIIKVGDYVKVKEDLHRGEYVSHDGTDVNSVVEDMLRFKGQKFKVTYVYEDGGFMIQGNSWTWLDSMVEKCDPPIEEFKVGDLVKIKEDLEEGRYTSRDGKVKNTVVHEMLEYKGRVCEIESVTGTGNFRLKGVNWHWVDTMFDRYELPPVGEVFPEPYEFRIKSEEEVSEVLYEKQLATHDDVQKVVREGRKIVVTLYDGTVGKSRCHVDDTFNKATGYEIAYRRAKIKQLEEELKDIMGLKK